MINKKLFNISQPKEIEIDGLFQDSKFETSSFNLDEIEVLFNNVPSLEYKFAIIEVKLSAHKLIDLINQLKNDYNIMRKIINQNTIYIGFICLNDNEYRKIKKYKLSEICGNFQCLILGIKNGIFSERNLTYAIDWKLVSQFYEFKKEFHEVKEEIRRISKLLGNKRKRY